MTEAPPASRTIAKKPNHRGLSKGPSGEKRGLPPISASPNPIKNQRFVERKLAGCPPFSRPRTSATGCCPCPTTVSGEPRSPKPRGFLQDSAIRADGKPPLGYVTCRNNRTYVPRWPATPFIRKMQVPAPKQPETCSFCANQARKTPQNCNSSGPSLPDAAMIGEPFQHMSPRIEIVGGLASAENREWAT